jgi:two-component system CheB/CheR fusion protein
MDKNSNGEDRDQPGDEKPVPESGDVCADAGAAPGRDSGPGQSGGAGWLGESCPIVGIGASAGGQEALKQLLKYLPVDTGLSFVLVTHLDPGYESALSDILSRMTLLPVSTVEDGICAEPDHIYVGPSNMDLFVSHGVLKLVSRDDTIRPRAPVDFFLESLARDKGRAAVGVILSGTASDGARGMKAIKAAGGFTFAQAPLSAQFDGMPRSAIATGAVDFVLQPAEIAACLAKICLPGSMDAGMAKIAELPDRADEFNKIIGLLRAASGIDFHRYKQLTVKRRISRRMVLHDVDNLADYVDYLIQNPAEVMALYQDILISVTNFFRDPESFDILKTRVLPNIINERDAAMPIRVWVPGCSTGEEAYSIAISLLEYLGDDAPNTPIQIFATDINEKVIRRARAGIYPRSIMADVSPERLRRYFVEVEKGYQVNKTIRDLCVFARHDLTSDPPFPQLDLISCRNVMIYLGPSYQKRMFPLFHFSLKPGGFIILGASESVGVFSDLFALVDKKYKIYSKKAVQTPFMFNLAFNEAAVAGLEAYRKDSAGRNHAAATFDVQKAADCVVLGQFAPAGVIINSDLEVIRFRGRTGSYLEPAAGPPSLNILKMARDELVLGLRVAINRAKKEDMPVKKEGLRVGANGRAKFVNVHVVPLKGLSVQEHYFLVLFEDVVRPGLDRNVSAGRGAGGWKREEQREIDPRTLKVEQELAVTKEYLQSLVEQYESVIEELRTANEEIQSSNEELQSMNEELETGKEELQSANEELLTLNLELQKRNLELSDINNDVQNLFRSINFPVVILDNDLHIRRFNSVAEKELNLIPSDIGRPIGHINLIVPDLEQEASEVTETLAVKEREVQDREGRWYSMQIRPYRTLENTISGVVVTFIEISSVKKFAAAQEAREFAEAIVETVREPLLVLNAEMTLKTANRAFYQTFQVTTDETINHSLFELGNGQWKIPALKLLLEDIIYRDSAFQDFEVHHDFPRIGRRTMLVNARRIPGSNSESKLILMAIEDITERVWGDKNR